MIPITVELRLDDGICFNEILIIIRLNELSIIESIYSNVSFRYINAKSQLVGKIVSSHYINRLPLIG